MRRLMMLGAAFVIFFPGLAMAAADARAVAEKKTQENMAELEADTMERNERKIDLALLFDEFASDYEKFGIAQGNRIYSFRAGGQRVSPKYKVLKCSEYDHRVFRLCPEADFFEANARIYFDKGDDGDGKVDLFKNGNLEPALQFAAVRLPWRFGRSDYFDPWSWGPEISAGLGTPAATGEEEGKKSTAPIVLVSAGLRLTYKITEEGSNFAFEVGRVYGFTTDESFGDNEDSATYVGIKIKYVPPKKD